MGLIVLVTGIFAGIAVSLATFYSIAQAVLTQGRCRFAHVAVLAFTFGAMAALQSGEVLAARILAAPLLVAAFWAFAVERRWFKTFPLLQQLFAVTLLAGWVAL